MKKRSWLQVGLVMAFACLLVAAGVAPAAGQDDAARWTPPLLIDEGWWPSMAVDEQGQVHIGWYGVKEEVENDDPADDDDLLKYMKRNLDGSWTTPNDVVYTGRGGYTVRNSLATTSDGTLFAAFRVKTSHFFASAYAPMAEMARVWSSPAKIAEGGYYIDLTADRNNVLHIVYGGSLDVQLGIEGSPENSPCGFCSDLIYRRSADGGKTWSPPYPLEITPNAGANRMDIFEGASGRLYVIWDEGYDWYVGRGQYQDVRIAYSDDGGLNWSDPIVLDGGNKKGIRPAQLALVELRDESLLAVWRYANDADLNLYSQLSSDLGETWTEPAAIPGLLARSALDSSLDDYELVIDLAGTVHLFAVGYEEFVLDKNPGLYHIAYRQGFWQTPVRLFYSRTRAPEWPKAGVGVYNDLHLTWFARGIREDVPQNVRLTGELEIYYSHLPGSMTGRATEAFVPTGTPPPTPTVFQNLEPTPTPFPTAGFLAQDLPLNTKDMNASETFLGGAFLAGLFCAAVVLATRLRR